MRDRVESVGDLTQVILAVKKDALAATEVSAHRDGGVAVLGVGVGVDEEVAVADVVIEFLGLVGDLADLAAGAPGRRVVSPGPLLVDCLTQ
ncbi:hypothetical protein [Streptomyces sp. NBC_01435]|uniref:hypothetical protein n=1 Tax=Streptomyces sp. NBC_01435 TaxID=2903865 RepID=UPI002E31FF05|nr:hypothetical protein [Streptomyces sp. NBC_01435]